MHQAVPLLCTSKHLFAVLSLCEGRVINDTALTTTLIRRRINDEPEEHHSRSLTTLLTCAVHWISCVYIDEIFLLQTRLRFLRKII